MTNPPIGTKAWLERHALFACQCDDDCYSETVFPASELRDLDGKPVCENCFYELDPRFKSEEDRTAWEADNGGDGPMDWSDLPPFNPFTCCGEKVQ